MRILWLKSDLLLPLDKGGKLRTWHLMRHLARRHEITYLAFAGAGAAGGRRRGHARGRAARRDDHAQRAGQRDAALLRGRGAAPARSAAVRRRQVPLARSTGAGSRACSTSERFDLIVCDFLFPAVNLPKRLPCPAVMFTHNVESEIWRRHAETKTRCDRTPALRRAVPADAALRGRTLRALRRRAGGLGRGPRDVRAPLSRRHRAAGLTSSRPASTPTTSRPAAGDASSLARIWSSPARWTGCRTKTRCSTSAATSCR